MAQEQTPRGFGFKKVQLFKEKQLGIGSYGKVCKAMCDGVMCAAKIIHPTLVDPYAQQQISPEKEHRLPLKRFEAECALLKEIRHPNIIRYLGMYVDPDTGLPVLLMELMDESLTNFLETSANPIPYGVEVSICLDVVRALSFLHLNDIIHRDLSSNNILLEGTYTAKLTDFGMAKFSNVRMTNVSNTTCPGTDAYMPPEACTQPVVYTAKGDVFSFGVNVVQIMTRKFPTPASRLKTVPINDPNFPSGTAEVRVSEVERRDNHIREVISTHPLLPIARDCLNDMEDARPSAEEVCQRLAALKNTPEYVLAESLRQFQRQGMPRQVRSQTPEARERPTSKRTIRSLNWTSGRDAPFVMKRDTNAVVCGNMAYFRPYGVLRESSHVLSFNSTTNSWAKLPDCPIRLSTLAVVNGLLTTVGGRCSNELFSFIAGRHKWTKVFPPMPTERHNVTAVTTNTALIVAGGEIYGYIRDKTTNVIEIMNIDTRQWSRAANLPQPMYRASATICGDRIYFVGGWATFTSHPLSVSTCSLSALIQSTAAPQHDLWSKIDDLPATLSTCVTFHDRLLAIGGRAGDALSTAEVYLFDPVNHSWKVIGYLSDPRHMCFVAVLPDDRLMVAGGETGLYPKMLTTVQFATVA